MNLEETKKIIENKIEAEALTKNVRSQIKSYIDQKQNLREGFKETFQPLIASQDAVKTSIDSQQYKLISQLQENQLALTEGLNKNRLAITSGFDKMEEVKRWYSEQLPSYEAIEHPEKETEETETEELEKTSLSKDEDLYEIKGRDLNKLLGEERYRDDKLIIKPFREISNLHKNTPMDKCRYKLKLNTDASEAYLVDMKPITTTTYRPTLGP